jgi:hypothetical protein
VVPVSRRVRPIIERERGGADHIGLLGMGGVQQSPEIGPSTTSVMCRVPVAGDDKQLPVHSGGKGLSRVDRNRRMVTPFRCSCGSTRSVGIVLSRKLSDVVHLWSEP